jgi:dTDP-4-amino-4,6-dideoxygalactose transaminase
VRRAALRSAVGESVVILFGNTERVTGEIRTGFFQEPNFYYLTGWTEPGAILVITAKTEEHAKTLRMLRHHGSRQTYLHERVGWNSRLDELQAAVLRVKLRHLDGFNAARRKVAQRYREKLGGANVILPAEHGRGTHVYHQFTIRSEKRDAIRAALSQEGIASSVFYPMPLHQQPAYASIAKGVSLPVSEKVSKTVLSLPIHPPQLLLRV